MKVENIILEGKNTYLIWVNNQEKNLPNIQDDINKYKNINTRVVVFYSGDKYTLQESTQKLIEGLNNNITSIF